MTSSSLSSPSSSSSFSHHHIILIIVITIIITTSSSSSLPHHHGAKVPQNLKILRCTRPPPESAIRALCDWGCFPKATETRPSGQPPRPSWKRLWSAGEKPNWKTWSAPCGLNEATASPHGLAWPRKTMTGEQEALKTHRDTRKTC